MILGDNPARHCLVLRDLVWTEFFQISHNCNWMHAAGKVFVKICLKPIRDNFFVEFPNFYPTEEESLNF